ncbi:hypothetical protein PHAVU_004G044066 [Phaseolus vulgaris]
MQITTTILQSVRTVVSRGNQCYLLTTNVTNVFPQVSLNFAGGASLLLRSRDYLIQHNSIGGAAVWCIGFQKIQGQGVTILGGIIHPYQFENFMSYIHLFYGDI